MAGIPVTVVLTNSRTYPLINFTKMELVAMPISDKYYRDLGDPALQTDLGSNTLLVASTEAGTVTSTPALAATEASFPDDQTHMELRQVLYDSSYWQFTCDGMADPFCWQYKLVAGFYPTAV